MIKRKWIVKDGVYRQTAADEAIENQNLALRASKQRPKGMAFDMQLLALASAMQVNEELYGNPVGQRITE